MRKIPIEIGKRFNRLTVVGFARLDKYCRPVWRYLCDCGSIIDVSASRVRNGQTKSCGCLQKEHAAAQSLSMAKHSKSYTPEYKVWGNMRERCELPSNHAYDRYGGRGIKVCDRWKSFENFLSDMGNRPSSAHSLDRIDNDGDYEPSNCRWATRKEQNRNRRSNRFIPYGDSRVTISEASEITGIKEVTISARIRKGWPEDRLFRPLRGAALPKVFSRRHALRSIASRA